MSEIQLTLATFDPSGESLCHGNPGLSGFNGLCHLCPNSFRTKKGVRCSLNDRLIKSRSKYQLPGWKALRQQILVRDQE
ncbi:MAG TPA: HNH endonuclease, partial [Methanoregulaceae archaeon]|nr:HNH endonuclease [Methanoregulaceae archaeon]